MKKCYPLVSLLFLFQFSAAQIINIPDVKLKTRLLDGWSTKDQSGNPIVVDANADGEISQSEALAVYQLEMPAQGSNTIVQNLTGISYFTNVTKFIFSGHNTWNVDLTAMVNLVELDVSNGSVSTLNLTGLNQLSKLNAKDNNLSNLNVSTLTGLTELNCAENEISTLDVSGMTQLQTLKCNDNNIGTLNLASINNLVWLDCYRNNLTGLNVANQPALMHLDCNNNAITNLFFAGLTQLQDFYCYQNHITVMDVSTLTGLVNFSCSGNEIATLDTSMLNNLVWLDCSSNELTSLTTNTQLTSLNCSQNLLTTLDVAPLVGLQALWCDRNQISVLDVAGLTNLTSFQCNENLLTSLNITPLVNLVFLRYGNENLAEVDLSTLSQLYSIGFYGGQQTSLILSAPLLEKVQVIGNSTLVNLDFSGSPLVNGLYLYNNPNLQYINAKNGGHVNISTMMSNGNLQYICANDADISGMQAVAAQYVAPNTLQINSYCSFTPGGAFNTISGVAHFDYNGDGCQTIDPTCNFLKVSISDGSSNGATFTQEPGVYSIPVQQPNLTLTPSLESASYFNISPASATISLPTNNGTVHTQDFCITPNGVHPDLEIVVLPMNSVMPGINAQYRINYRNKGNQVLSGSVNFTFNDDVSDFAIAYPSPDTQGTGVFSWNFADLLPFQEGDIMVYLDMNTPQDTPPVNGGDTVNLTASIAFPGTDDAPSDNMFTLAQTVVNSFDPNDKTCLEGNSVGPEIIGKYVHYMIRFENTGTANAQNIVIRDMIDTAKFDVASLMPLQGSHPFTTRISSGNKVEFIFENINLPFDDANNDGYVAFKIKTKPTLTVGDTFSNTASIYFDYNFPIVTNTATTTIQLLGTPDFEFSEAFTLYPNPAQDLLYIQSHNGPQITSISIYNAIGQLARTQIGHVTNLDVSALNSGVYFVRIFTESGVATNKFIKQ